MEQQLESATNPGPRSTPRGANRCRHRSNSKGRCRFPAQDPDTGLCFLHAARLRKTTGTFDDTCDLSTDLFGTASPGFQSAEEINATLTNLVILVARGRLSPRRASVITYALSFILRGLQVIDQKAAGDPVEFVMDIDSAVARRALANANEREANLPR